MLSLSFYHSCVKEHEGHRCPRLALRARAVAEGFAARSGEAEEEAEQTQDFCRVLVEVGGDMWVGVCSCSPNSVFNTWGSYGRWKGRGARSRCRTEFVAIFVLSCLHVHFRRYLRTFRVAAVVGPRCCVWIFVVSGSSTSSMFIFRGNSRTFRCSAMLLNGSETGFAW